MLKFEGIAPLGGWFGSQARGCGGKRSATRRLGRCGVPSPAGASASGAANRTTWSPPWRSGRGRLVDAYETEAGQTYAQAHRSAGSRSVALLPRVRAAKLTIYASYW